MDFGKLDLRAAAEKEYWVQLRLDDRLLYLNEEREEGPLRVRLASPANPDVEEASKALKRAADRQRSIAIRLSGAANRQERKTYEGQLDASEIDCEKAIKVFLCTAIKGWENIHRDGKPIPFTKEELADLSEPKAPLSRLAIAISEDMAKTTSPFSEVEIAS